MMLARLSVAAVLVLVASASGALADGRVALVIGNSTYAHAGRLPNAENDATDMAAALRRLGFEVTTELDTDFAGLNGALRDFTDRSAGADVAVVFYAGHGMGIDGVNYLVPVDARLAQERDVRFEAVTLDDMLASTLGASLRLVILEQRTLAGQSVSPRRFENLNVDLLGNETLVAYAAEAGTTAADGRGRNSPYTAALLAHLESSHSIEIRLLFHRVHVQVLTSTNVHQLGYASSLGVVDHYLSVPPPAESGRVEAALPVAVVDAPVGRRTVAPEGR